jgi:predicted nucleic acid-binding protein
VSRLVLDGSMTMTWCFADEATDATAAVLRELDGGEAVVPGIWALEVANSLLVAERKRRISDEKSSEFVSMLEGLPILVDPDETNRTFGAVLSLAREAGLTSYDASYLELAIRSNLPLASLDAPLRKAARARGVALLPAD